MKKMSSFILLLIFVSCSSVTSIQKNPHCVVWKDQKYLGPYSIEVIEKKISWKGLCKGGHWNCKTLEMSLDENNNILKETVVVGKIEGESFNYSPAPSDLPLITYTSVKVNSEKNELEAVGIKPADNVLYHTNGKCSSSESILGAVALGLIADIQDQK